MTPQVYETGPLRGLPRRAGHLRLVSPPIGDAMPPPIAQPINVEALPESIRTRVERLSLRSTARANAYPYAGDTALNDQLAIPGIPADAPPPPVQTIDPAPFRSATPIVVIIAACTLLYFAVRMLGLPS